MSQLVSTVRLLAAAVMIFALALVFACKSNDSAGLAPVIEETPMQTARLASGVVGGTYHDQYVPELDGKLGGWILAAIPTGGSSENLDLLSTGEVDLALTQADVFASRVAEEPEVFGLLSVLGSVGEECVFIARWVGGPVDSFDDLSRDVGDREAVINVGTPDSGMFVTWGYISSRVPEQANAEIDDHDGQTALVMLEQGTVDAVAWMTDPSNADHVLLTAVQADPDLDFMVVDDERLAFQLDDGTVVYALRSVEVPGSDGVMLDTVCTQALLVAGPETDPALVAAIEAAGIGN
jgi:hypothetical protein